MKSKSLKYFIPLMGILLIGALAFSACSTEKDNIEIEQPLFTFEWSTGGMLQTTKVMTDKEWSINPGYEEWIIPAKSETRFIVVGVKDNNSGAPRKGEIVIKCGNATAVLKVEQDGKIAAE